jgi:hypothetical protein
MIAKVPITNEVKETVDSLIAKLDKDLWKVNHEVRAAPSPFPRWRQGPVLTPA